MGGEGEWPWRIHISATLIESIIINNGAASYGT